MSGLPLMTVDRWNDKALDQLSGRVDDTANEVAVLRPALTRQAKMETAIASLLEAHRDFRDETRKRFDRIDEDHGRSREETPTKQWLGIVIAIIGLLSAVVVALISAYVTLKTGASK